MVWPVYLMQIKIHTYINMVKNIPTIERSTKIRFGKHVSDSQAENTIVFNASDTAVNATNTGSIYMAPLRVAELAGSNLIGYSATTKEVVDSSVPSSLLGGVTLQASTDRGNVTSNTVQFTNAITSFVASSFVGIQNTAPTHAISVADKVFIHNVNSIDRITVVGNVRASKFTTTTNNALIQDGETNKIQVSGRIHSSDLTTTKIGLANTAPDHALSIGNEGQVQMNVPTGSIYALDTVGNVNAQNYRGDSYYLSNLTVENIVNQGNVTSNTVQFTNATTGIHTSSNVDVGGNIFVRNNTDSAIYGTIAGANTISASSVTTTSPIQMASGGTGQGSYTDGTILYGKASGTALGTLTPAGSNADAGKFLKLGSSDIPEWSTVPLTLDAVLGDTTASSDGSMSLTDTGTTITTAGKIKAATFEGSGSDLNSINASNVVQAAGSTLSTDVLPTVPENKGGTGQTTYTKGQVLYSDVNDSLAKLGIGSANQILQVNTDVPGWTSTITGATLSGPSLTGTITTSSLTANRIPFTNSSKELVTDSKLQFDGDDLFTIGSNVEITGNLHVVGNLTARHENSLTINDPLIEVGNNNSSDTIDLGMIMTMGTANVVHGFRGNEKEYTIAYTHSDPVGPDIVPTLASGITDHPYITANIWGNVLSGNVTTTGKVTAGTPIEIASGGTGISTIVENELLLGPASGTTLTKLAPHTASSKKFLRSDNTGVAWDDVSSTLQAITDGGATTTHTIAFNNATTGLTSAGDITIASTKKLTFADDILLEGGSGTSNLKVNNAIILSPEVQDGSTSTKNVLSIDTTTGEIFDSGGQGGSTMEFTHEEGTGIHANVSIGKNAWAGPTGESNLTINTYGSNVLTVTGNVSATNITIGGLHVAASPFNLDDVASAGAGANVTSNVIQFTGPPGGYTTDNAFVTTKSISIGSNVNVTGNVTSQNLQLTNTQIATTWTSGSGTLAIDAKNKSYGTAPLTSIDADVAILSVTNLPSGGQVVVPLLASGADRKVLKTITSGIDFIAFTTDVSIDQNGHGLLTVSKIGASGAEKIYMNAIAFTAA